MLFSVASPFIVRTLMSRFGSKFLSHRSNVSRRYDAMKASIGLCVTKAAKIGSFQLTPTPQLIDTMAIER